MIFSSIKRFFTKLFGKKNKKLGLALGSGGAKGLFHVGALHAFEEEGITFDVVSGCSIGSIVGGMYSAGFSSASILEYLRQLDLTNVASLVIMKLSGMTVEKTLDRVMGGANIEDLSIPFGAVAVDVFEGEQVNLTSGKLSKVMCASSAIPPFFKGVQIDGRVLIDGAYLNSVPADLAKELGADFVIGINLGAETPTNEQILGALDSAYRGHGVQKCNRAEKGEQFSDYMLCPDLSNYSSTSITKMAELYELGYNYTKQVMPQIKLALKKAKIKRG